MADELNFLEEKTDDFVKVTLYLSRAKRKPLQSSGNQ
jgi:hypothetical protein